MHRAPSLAKRGQCERERVRVFLLERERECVWVRAIGERECVPSHIAGEESCTLKPNHDPLTLRGR